MLKAIRTLYRNELGDIPEFGSRELILKDELPYTKLRLTYLIDGQRYFFWAENKNTTDLTAHISIMADMLDISENLVEESFLNDETWYDEFMVYLSKQDLVKIEVTKRQVVKEPV